jgi:Mrp family chromosome partitioning ATPase
MSRNRRTAVKRAAELLQTNNVPVIGIVCNGTDASTGGYDYRSVYTSDAPVEVKPVEQKAEELVPV